MLLFGVVVVVVDVDVDVVVASSQVEDIPLFFAMNELRRT